MDSQASKKIRVLLLAPQKAVGGISTWAKTLLKYSDPGKVEYRVIDTSRLYVELGQRLGLRGALSGLQDAVVRFFRVMYQLIRFHPNLVYINSSPSIGLLVRDVPLFILLRCLGVKAIAHLHGGNVAGFFGQRGLRKLWSCLGLKCCYAVFVITREIEREGRKRLNSQRIIYVPNMIDDAFVAKKQERHIRVFPENQPFKLIHVAWQAPEKGSLDIVKAMEYIETPVKCELVGIAAPENVEIIEKKIRELNVGDKVRLAGLRTGSDLRAMYENAGIFLLPTHREGPEGFPMVILEAMAYGLPIIANDVGNIREMIGYDTDAPAGLLLEQVDPVNPKELADKIDRLIKDYPLRQKMSINGRKRIVENYLASKVVPNLESLLVELVFTRPTPKSISSTLEQKYI